MKSFTYISALVLLLVFTTGCQKYEVIGPDESQEDITLRREMLINDPVFEEESARRADSSDLKILIADDEGDGIDGITDDDDEDDDSEESQDKSSSN
jgi:hypothetical protein